MNCQGFRINLLKESIEYGISTIVNYAQAALSKASFERALR